MSVNQHNRLVTLSRSPQTGSDADGFFEPLTPATIWCSIQPVFGVSEGRSREAVVEMRFHPQVTMDTRLTFYDAVLMRQRELFVRGVQHLDEGHDLAAARVRGDYPVSVELVFEGLEELRAELRQLPAELAAEAVPIVTEAAERLKGAIVSAYPVGPTGNLQRGVQLQSGLTGRFGAAAVVRSSAKHAWIYERGTKPRRTAKGANRGVMPKGDVVIPNAQRVRLAMYRNLQALLERHGFEVSES